MLMPLREAIAIYTAAIVRLLTNTLRAPQHTIHVPAVQFYLFNYNDIKCRHHFMFAQHELQRLILLLPDVVFTQERITGSRVKALCAMLRRLTVANR